MTFKLIGYGSDDQRLYSELDDEFYGFSILRMWKHCLLLLLHELIEESDEEDISTDDGFDITSAISGANSGEVDDSSFLLPVDDEKIAVHAELERVCGFPHDCYRQFSEEEVYQSRLRMAERDMLMLGKLMVCGCTADSVSHARAETVTKRRRIIHEYSYDHRVVCKSVFCFMHV